MNPRDNDLYEDNVVYREFKGFFDLGGKVYDFANKCVDDQKPWKEDGAHDAHLYETVSILFFRSFKTFISVLFLCNKGHGEDAMGLARILFENYLTLRYIQQDPADRIYKFMNYHLLDQKFMLERAMQPISKLRPDIKEMYLEKKTRILDNYRKVKKFYVKEAQQEDKSLRKFRSGRWAGISIKEMAEELCLLFDYDYVFHVHSQFIHPRPYGLRSFRQETDSDVRYGAEPSGEDIFPALPIATRYFLLVLREWTRTFQLHRDEPVESLLNHVTQVENDHLRKQGFLK